MDCYEWWWNIKMKKHQTFIFLLKSFKIIYISLIMTILVKNNFNLLMQQYFWVYNIFLLSHLSSTQTNWMVRQHATYNCLCEKHDVLKSKLQTDIVWPWDIFIVITNANLIGNWRRLNCIGTSMGIIGIRGNNIFSPRNLLFKIMVSITFFINFLMTNRACRCTTVVGSNYKAK
jgi:hypothetical protein